MSAILVILFNADSIYAESRRFFLVDVTRRSEGFLVDVTRRPDGFQADVSRGCRLKLSGRLISISSGYRISGDDDITSLCKKETSMFSI